MRVRLSSASLFLPIASSRCATLSRSLGAPARSRDTAPFITREASPPISRREIPYGKNIWRRETATRAQSSSGGTRRERNLREKSNLKRADESRADRVSESTKFSNEDCDRHASSCTRRIDSIPRPLYIYTRARVIITPRRVIIIVEIRGTEEESAKRYYNISISSLASPRNKTRLCRARNIRSVRYR